MDEYILLTLADQVEQLSSRVENLQNELDYSNRGHVRTQNDWFGFENRCRSIVMESMSPSMKRVQDC